MGQVSFEVPGPGTYNITADPTLAPLDSPGAAADVLTGKQFYRSDNTPVTGTMPNNPPTEVKIEAGGSYTIPQGYHSGEGKVISQGTALPTLDNPGTAADLLAGKELIDAEGEKVTGSMANNGAVNETLNAGDSYTIPAGYHNGNGSVAAASLSSQTTGTADAGDIVSGQTAWVNGEQITGTATPGTDISDATATADQILSPYTAYVASGKVTGNIPTNADDDVTISDDSVIVSAGYYADSVSKAIPTVAQAVPSITVSKTGLITATAAQDAGYVAQGTQSATQQLTVQGAQTITPGTAVQTIAAGRYLTGAQTIQGDANLVAGNIKDGVSIFGVQGTYSGEPATFAVPLVVTVASGATVTAQNGDTTLTAVSNGTATIMLTTSGEWTVFAELNGEKTNSVVIDVRDSYSASLYFSPLIPVESVTSLSFSTPSLAATSIGNYALFGGGQFGTTSTFYSSVNSFDENLTREIQTSLSRAREKLAATSVGNYALFGGGNGYSIRDIYNIVDAFNSELVHSSPTGLSVARSLLASAHIGSYAIFAGGSKRAITGSDYNLNTVDAYNSSLTRTIPTALSVARGKLVGTNNANYAIFAGPGDDVDAYNRSLTHTIPSQLRISGNECAGTPIGEYALFAGNSSGMADAYDSELTRISAPNISNGGQSGATTLQNYAIFAGGDRIGTSSPTDAVNVYDENLTLISPSPSPLSLARRGVHGATVGDYAVFAGGTGNTGSNITSVSKVDAYTFAN